MPKRSNDFQKLIYLIHHQLANEATVTESEYLYDRAANADREVDIVIQTLIGTYQVIIGIECQGRGRIASVEWVEQMVAKHETLPTNKLILVSQSGFSPNAYKKANALGIETMTIGQAIKADWNAFIRLPEVILGRWKIEPIACFPILTENNEQVDTAKLDFEQKLYDEGGNELFTINETIEIYMDKYSEEIVLNFDKNDTQTVTGFIIEFSVSDNTYLVDTSHSKVKISGLRVLMECSYESELVKLQNGSFGHAQVAFGKTHVIDPEALVSIIEHKDGPNTGAIMLTSNNKNEEAQIIKMRRVRPGEIKTKTKNC